MLLRRLFIYFSIILMQNTEGVFLFKTKIIILSSFSKNKSLKKTSYKNVMATQQKVKRIFSLIKESLNGEKKGCRY